jgi:glucose/arabinose dehydrogenase
MTPPRWLLSSAIGFLAWLVAIPAFALPPGFSIQVVHGSVNFPTSLRFAPDGRLFFTELTGRVAYYPSLSFPNSVTWTRLSAAGGGERGVNGLAFHPDFPDSPFVYVSYTDSSTVNDRLVRFQDQLGEGRSPTLFMEYSGSADHHHGGRIAFGPDGMMYLTHGDQEDLAAAQNIADVRGKIFRLGRGGKPAPGNPFGPTNPVALYGVRNSYGLCFDPVDGTGYFTDNGPDCDDELNLLTFGTNYGWGPNDPCNGTPSGTRAPLTYINPTIGVTGCCVYRGGVYPSRWDGSLFFGAVNNGLLYRVRFQAGRPDLVDTLDVFADLGEGVLDVTVGPDGFLWVATLSRLVRIVYTPPAVGVGAPNVDLAPRLRMAPNPFRAQVALEIENAPAGARVEVIDLQGRRIQTWSVTANRRMFWDGRDARGDRAPPGIYLVRLSGAGVELTRRLIRLGG